MIEHGSVTSRNTPGPRTLCKCGKEFDTDKGLDVHVGRMKGFNTNPKGLENKPK